MNEPMNEPMNETTWHFDRRIPIAMILAIVLQTVGAVWWASGVSSYIEADRIAGGLRDNRITTVERISDLIGNRMTRMETLLESQAEMLRDIRDALKARP